MATAPISSIFVDDQNKMNRAFSYINDSLDQNQIVAVGYHPEGLIVPPIKPPLKPSGHASVITGRHYVAGEGCYITIKNSWGTKWPGKRLDNSNRDAKAAVDKDGKILSGYYQVKDVDFAKYITSVTNIGNDPKIPSVTTDSLIVKK